MPHILNAKQTLRVFGAVLQAKADSIVYENGYEGWLCCGGYGRLMLRQQQDKPEADVLIRMPGRALEWIRFENVVSETDSQCTDVDICRFFLDHGFHATRIDLAMDCTDKEVSPQLVEKHLRGKHFTCKARRAGVQNSWELGNDSWEAATIYIGGRTSTRFVRIYDKQAEVYQKTGRRIDHLTRFEMENKYEAASRVMEMVADSGMEITVGLFRGWIDFKDCTDTATRVERRQSAVWWDRIVGESAPITVGLTRGIATPEKTLKWIKRQVAKTLYLIQKFNLEQEIRHAIAEKALKVKKSELAKWDFFKRALDESEGIKPWENSKWEGENNAHPAE